MKIKINYKCFRDNGLYIQGAYEIQKLNKKGNSGPFDACRSGLSDCQIPVVQQAGV